jgi:hypothetical protein
MSAAYGCWGRIDVLAAVRAALAVSTEEGRSNDALRTFPNPVADDWHIVAPLAGEYRLWLFSTDGRLVLEQKLTASADGLPTISAAALPSGVYFWRLQNTTAAWQGSVLRNV